MSSYTTLAAIHILTAFISVTGFFMRGIWMMRSSSLLQQRWVRVAPHINDTVLLLSAIALVFITSQYPGPAAWLNAKIVALVVYIVLGVIALNRGKTKGVRVTAWCLALLAYTYIMVVAFSKNALPI